MQIEFQGWPKMTRFSPWHMTVTEKINGTNAAVYIRFGEILAVQSRNRFITPESDNFGFASWVRDNSEKLVGLGDGRHFGEWAGPGIQKNPHEYDVRRFFLFNTGRWTHRRGDLGGIIYTNQEVIDAGCDVVPILFEGELPPTWIAEHLERQRADTVYHEGVCAYSHAFKAYAKYTLETPNGKWCKE